MRSFVVDCQHKHVFNAYNSTHFWLEEFSFEFEGIEIDLVVVALPAPPHFNTFVSSFYN